MSFVDLWKIENSSLGITDETVKRLRKRDEDEEDTRVYALFPED